MGEILCQVHCLLFLDILALCKILNLSSKHKEHHDEIAAWMIERISPQPRWGLCSLCYWKLFRVPSKENVWKVPLETGWSRTPNIWGPNRVSVNILQNLNPSYFSPILFYFQNEYYISISHLLPQSWMPDIMLRWHTVVAHMIRGEMEIGRSKYSIRVLAGADDNLGPNLRQLSASVAWHPVLWAF